MGGREDLIASLRAIMARRDLDRESAPSAEELLAYRDGLLDAEDRTRLEARLAAFPDAARALRDLAAFPNVEPAPGVEPPSEEEIDRGWRSFRRDLEALEMEGEDEEEETDEAAGGETTAIFGASQGRPLPLPVIAKTRPPQAVSSPWLLLAATVTLLALGAVAGWFFARHDDGPSINTVVVELEPLGAVRERSFQPLGTFEEEAWQAAERVAIPPGTGRVVLVLAVLDAGQFADYSLRMENAEGDVMWSRRGLRRLEDGTFSVDLPGGSLAPGRYQLSLDGVGNTSLQPVATYLLIVVGE